MICERRIEARVNRKVYKTIVRPAEFGVGETDKKDVAELKMTIPLNGKVMSKRKYFHRNPQLSSYQMYATNPGLCCILYFCIAFLYIHVLLRHVSGFESKVNALHQACQLSKLQSWFRPLL